ncbi:putative ankyrin repeat protein RBE_0317 [Macadamia integrifolia]|uniref:putative ankyrin repeat protein RBE_0317 n=1 Tax=Macadamia integrifolia TaxID=60698 RepID=UPI001C4E642B|nr:putative ankyrin repeat protein RBE_0317 [Macadamia integrifolia]
MDPGLRKALYKAVTEGDHSTLRLKLSEAAKDKELVYQNDNTLLHIAANYDNVPVVRVIRENQPTSILRSKNYRKDTALHIAARHNNVEIVKYLLGWAKEVDEEENQSKSDNLHKKKKPKSAEKVKGNQLEPHKTVKKKNRDGNTALHEAVLGRHHNVIEVLREESQHLWLISLSSPHL